MIGLDDGEMDDSAIINSNAIESDYNLVPQVYIRTIFIDFFLNNEGLCTYILPLLFLFTF